MAQVGEQILDAIELIAQNIVGQAGYDRTIQAMIVSCVDAEKGKYKIKYQGNTFFAFSTDISKTYKDGINVYVNVPQNDFSQTKTILCAVGNMGESMNIIAAPETAYEELGFDCLIEKDLNKKLKLDKNTSSIVLFENNSVLNPYLDKVLISDFEAGVKQWGSFVLRMDVISSIVPKDSETIPHYGIKITFNNDPSLIAYLDSEDMSGNPYLFGQQNSQAKYYSSQQSLTITKVEVYASDFSGDNTVWLSNLQLIPCQKLKENEIAQRRLNILFLNGITFENTDSVLTAQAILKEKGSIVSLPANKINYYWFLEQPSVTTEDKVNYNKYAGEGWVAANNGEITNAPDKYNFYSKDVKQQSRRIKCVLVYKDDETEIVYSQVSTLFQNKPLFSDNDLFIEYSLNKTVWQVGTTLKVTENIPFFYLKGETSKKISNVKYIWSVMDETEDLSTFDNSESYITVSREQVNALKIYYCSYFSKDNEYLGLRSFSALANEEELPYQLSIINPHQVFIYDEFGIAPTEKAAEDKTILQPLTVKLIDTKNAQFITADQIAAQDIIWYFVADSKERLISIDYDPSSVIEETIDGTLYYGVKGQDFHFTLVAKYATKANSNNIKVKVSYKGYTLWGETSVTCYKVGDPGVRSANRYCEIVPTKEKSWSYMPTLIYQQNGSSWYHNDLYADGTEWFKARVFNGEEWTELSGSSVEWKILGTKELKDTIKDKESFLINNNLFAARDAAWINNYLSNNKMDSLFSLVQGRITYQQGEKDKEILYATAPLSTLIKSQELLSYDVQLVDNSGFKYIKYNCAGQSPQYDGSRPFQLLIQKDGKDITDSFSYEWNTFSSFYDIVRQAYIETNLLKGTSNKQYYDVQVNSSVETSSYLAYNAGVSCKIKKNNVLIGYYFLPIDIYKMTSDNSIVNGWDGYSLEMGNGSEDEQSYLMANMVGAGTKEENGAFTGVLMGQIGSMTTDRGNTFETGLMGYNKGQRSFFVDAKDGSTILGIEQSGQIKIIPGKYPVIESGNYSSFNGMRINFGTAPSIEYGNGNFQVNSQGVLYAKGATIEASDDSKVSFRISDNGINMSSEQGNTYSSIQMGDTSNFSFVTYDENGEIESGIIYDKGNLQITGRITATSGSIGGWEISAHKIASRNGGLILYDDGRIVGYDQAKEDDTEDDGWLDISNRSLNWRQYSGTERVYNSKTGQYETRNTYTSLGTLTTDLSGNLNATCSGSANISGSDSSSLISGSSSATVTSDTGLSVSKQGSKVFESGVMSTEKGTNSFLTIYQKESVDTASVYGIKRYKYTGVKPTPSDTDDKWEYVIGKEAISVGSDGAIKKQTIYSSASKDVADAYWLKINGSQSTVKTRAEALEAKSDKYIYSIYPVLQTSITNVIGQSPQKVKLEKDGNNYVITETYDNQIFGGLTAEQKKEKENNYDNQIKQIDEKIKAAKTENEKEALENEKAQLEKEKADFTKAQDAITNKAMLNYKIEMDGDQVKSLTFPSGYVMSLEGFEF